MYMYCVHTQLPVIALPSQIQCLNRSPHWDWVGVGLRPLPKSSTPASLRIRRPMAVNWNDFSTKNTLVGLGLGQLLSLLVTSTGFASSDLAKRGISAPTSQSFINYALLALVYGGIMLCRRQALKAKWYYYVVLGLVDVEANFLVVKAYQYTSITSVMLLDCWTIPCVLFLTWFFLKTNYRFKKFIGVGICVAGLVVVIFSDVHSADRTSGGANPIKGDLLAITGATLYAVSNVSEEFFVKSADRVELMAFLGIFGAMISACQIGILERHELESIHWSPEAAIPFVGFSLAMFLFYSGVPILLKISGSTMLNLSLLTSDMWAVFIRIFAYGEKVDWMYYVAFAAVAVGLIVYSSGDDNAECETVNVGKHLDEEAGLCCSNKDKSGESCKTQDVGSSSTAEKDGLLTKRLEGNKSPRHLVEKFLQD